jgi:hypothetical protein
VLILFNNHCQGMHSCILRLAIYHRLILYAVLYGICTLDVLGSGAGTVMSHIVFKRTCPFGSDRHYYLVL